jgi:ATP-dependent Clp protease adapter protein ClpS
MLRLLGILAIAAPVCAWVPHRAPRALAPTSLARRVGPLHSSNDDGDTAKQKQIDKKSQYSTIVKDDQKTEIEEKVENEDEGWWRVLLHNDEVHTFEYVTEAVVKVVPSITRKKAFNISRQVHQNGVGTITTVWKSMAMKICMALQTFGLTMSIAEDKNFEDNNEGGESGGGE